MGQILSNPDIRKETDKLHDLYTAYGLCCMQGWRMSMEDQHITQLNLKPSAQDSLENFDDHLAFYAVFDGHGGSSIAEFSGNNVHHILAKELNALYKKTQVGATKLVEDSGLRTKEIDSSNTSSNTSNNNNNNNSNDTEMNNDSNDDSQDKSNKSNCNNNSSSSSSSSNDNKSNNDKSIEINYAKAMIDCFLHTDEEILKDKILKMDHSGCTATSVLISKKFGKIVCANSGDSRTVLSTSKFAKNLSYDHKPTNAGEKARIFNAGGFVEMSRVNGNLALSRAIGDFEFKQNHDLPPHEQIVTVVPDVLEHLIDYEHDEFVILACDGIWDCLTSQECVDLIHYGIMKENMLDLSELSSKIVDVCCSPDAGGQGIGCDNMSMMIVALLKDNESVDEWFSRIKAKNHVLDESINFVNYRKKIFNYYAFNDENIFSITTPRTFSNNAPGSAGLGESDFHSMIKSRLRYSDEDEDEEMDEDEDEEMNEGEENDSSARKAEEMEDSEESDGSGKKKVVLNLNDFLQQNGSLTRDENGMTYIQGHLLNEVLESLASGRQQQASVPADDVTTTIEEVKDSEEEK